MSRKKKRRTRKEENDSEDDDAEEQIFSLQIHGDAKRSIAAILFVLAAILFVLGFFDYAGVVGQGLDRGVSLAFGWGKWLSPIVLVIASVVLLRRSGTFFYVTRLIGISIAFVSVLGLLHIHAEADQMFELAQNGSGGGYVGYALADLLVQLMGFVAGIVVLIALLLVGLIITFNFSFTGVGEKLWNIRWPDFSWRSHGEKQEEADAEGNIDYEEDSEKESDDEDVEKPSVVKEDIKKNRGNTLARLRARVDGIVDHTVEIVDDVAIIPPSPQKWKLPSLRLLEKSSGTAKGGDVKMNAQIIEDTLRDFGIDVEAEGIITGPTVTQYSFRPAAGMKLSRITALNNDLALALAKHPIRIEAPIPGKSLIGIEVPNSTVSTVRLRELLSGKVFSERLSNLIIALGKDVSGMHILEDVKKMPHLLIAGSTGSGKSVSINSILLSLLYQNSPNNLRLILVDPKRVELSLYNGIPHLLTDVIVENGKVLNALKWAIGEMERRYKLLQETSARDLTSYNQKIRSGTKRIIDPDTGEENGEDHKHLPFILIVIDELADLMSSHGKEVENAIVRLAQMARAVGIHLIVSTQRPSVSVLTGLIKANITTRIALKVATQIDSRTILDCGGAEKLVGNGDMLYLGGNTSKPKRLQGVFVTESEVRKVVDFIKGQSWKQQEEEGDIAETIILSGDSGAHSMDDADEELYEEAKDIIITAGKASASLLQRRLRIGYSRAARLLDMLENNGIVSPADGAKPREILVGKDAMENTAQEDPLEDQEKRDKWQM